jgi:hypothetical protein
LGHPAIAGGAGALGRLGDIAGDDFTQPEFEKSGKLQVRNLVEELF